MILVAGIPSESPVKLVTDAASAAEVPCVIFNQREAHSYDMSLQMRNNEFNGFLRIRGQEYPLSSFKGVYVRMMDYAFLPEIKDRVFNYVGDSLAEKSISIHQQFLHWLEFAACRVLNRPSDMSSNLSKPYQYQIIAAAGFCIPPTCITSDEQVVRRFQSKHKSLIFKSISSARSIVHDLDQSRLNQLRNVRYLPTQFQQRLKGVNIRVHVVGDVTFATKIDSEVVDYRYSSREGKETSLTSCRLPKRVEKRCLQLSKTLNLPLCGIDLFMTRAGEYFCFEVNPSPGYSYYQAHTGQDIAASIVNYLEYGKGAT